MKLADYQISAIVSEMRKPFALDQKAKKLAIKEKAMPKIKAKAKKIADKFRNISLEELKYCTKYNDVKKVTAASVEKDLINNIDYSGAPDFDERAARQKVILASISSANIEELKQKLGVKF